jgi:hypothetical protein
VDRLRRENCSVDAWKRADGPRKKIPIRRFDSRLLRRIRREFVLVAKREQQRDRGEAERFGSKDEISRFRPKSSRFEGGWT